MLLFVFSVKKYKQSRHSIIRETKPGRPELKSFLFVIKTVKRNTLTQ